MYTREDGAAAGTVAKTTLPVIGAIICGALLLLLLASTIVLALIPVYTPTKSVTLSTNSAKSQAVTAFISASGNARRRRQGGALDAYEGATCSDSAKTATQSSLKSSFTEDAASYSDVQVESCGIETVATRRRRFAFSKRGSSTCFKVVFYLFYTPSCRTKSRQTKANANGKTRFKNHVNNGRFAPGRLLFYKGGVPFYLSMLFFGFPFDFDILSGLETGKPRVPGSSTSGGSPVTSNIG